MKQARDQHGILTDEEHVRERVKDLAYGAIGVLAIEGVLFLLHVLGRI